MTVPVASNKNIKIDDDFAAHRLPRHLKKNGAHVQAHSERMLNFLVGRIFYKRFLAVE